MRGVLFSYFISIDGQLLWELSGSYLRFGYHTAKPRIFLYISLKFHHSGNYFEEKLYIAMSILSDMLILFAAILYP